MICIVNVTIKILVIKKHNFNCTKDERFVCFIPTPRNL